MPHHAQFKKSIRQDEKRRLRNRAAMSRLRTVIKKVRSATTKADGEKILQSAISLIDSTARKGIIKANTASRNVS
ncbi:MAG: 30S ribosomal protein S20, partial [Candidatus Latescibacterota bacterium]